MPRGARRKRPLGDAGTVGTQAFGVKQWRLRQLDGAFRAVTALAHDAAIPHAEDIVGGSLPPTTPAHHRVSARIASRGVAHYIRFRNLRPDRARGSCSHAFAKPFSGRNLCGGSLQPRTFHDCKPAAARAPSFCAQPKQLIGRAQATSSDTWRMARLGAG